MLMCRLPDLVPGIAIAGVTQLVSVLVPFTAIVPSHILFSFSAPPMFYAVCQDG